MYFTPDDFAASIKVLPCDISTSGDGRGVVTRNAVWTSWKALRRDDLSVRSPLTTWIPSDWSFCAEGEDGLRAIARSVNWDDESSDLRAFIAAAPCLPGSRIELAVS